MQFVAQVRERTDILDLAREAGMKLERKGYDQYVGKPPWRPNEKDGSLRIYAYQQSFHDYGDPDAGTDVIDFVMRWKGIEFREAINFLAERAGLDWKPFFGGGGSTIDEAVQHEMDMLIERRRVKRVATDCARYYHECLPDEAREWLKDNYAFTDEVIDECLVGFADGTLLAAMKDKGYSTNQLLETGLFMKTRTGKVFEQHEQRVTFPYFQKGQCPYMISRRVPGITPDTDFQKAKYKKSLVHRDDKHQYVSKYVKNDIFYGEDSVEGRRVRQLVITEGVTDAISAKACGYPVISPVTTRFRKRDVDRALALAEQADEVIIINDNEAPTQDPRTGRIIQPGLDGAVEMADAFMRAGRVVKIGILPRPDSVDKVDINSLVAAGGKEALQVVVNTARPFIQFLIDRLPEEIAPALLDEKLSPVYEAIAYCQNTVTREAYAVSLAKKYGLTPGTVLESVREFMKAKGPLPKPPALPEDLKDFMVDSTAAGSGGSGDGGGGDDGDGGGFDSDPPEASGGSRRPAASVDFNEVGIEISRNMKGAIFLHKDWSVYVEVKPTKEGVKLVPVSNFVIEPKRIIVGEGKRYIHIDVYIPHIDRWFNSVAMNLKHLRSAKDFRAFLTEAVHHGLSFSGNDQNIESLKMLLSPADLKEISGTTQVGYHAGPDGKPYYVCRDKVIGVDGIVEDPPIAYASEDSEGSKLSRMIDMRGAATDDATIAELAQRVMPKVFRLNDGGVIMPAIGWFAAAAVSVRIREILEHFPFLLVWGMAGSGKSTLMMILLRIFAAIDGEMFIAGDTAFARTKRIAGSTTTPVFHDEFRDLAPANEASLYRKLRENYTAASEQRGRQDQSVVNYPNQAPLGIIGESKTDDPAIMERCICVSPLKSALNDDRRQLMEELLTEDLALLGGHFQRWCLSIDVGDYLAEARKMMDRKLTALVSNKLAPRVFDNMLVMVAGNLVVGAWCKHLGVDVTTMPEVADHFVQAVVSLTEREDGGPSKDAFDSFIERLSTLAIQGRILEGVHYGYLDKTSPDYGCIWLQLAACHAEYLQNQRQMGQGDNTLGLNALKRTVREKEAQPSDYVVDRSRRVRCGSNSQYRRCVLINPSKVPDFLDFEKPPQKPEFTRAEDYPSFSYGPEPGETQALLDHAPPESGAPGTGGKPN